MVADVRVLGASGMKILGREIQRAGRKDLKVEFKKEMQRFTRDNMIREAIAQSALDTLPSGGGHQRGPRPKGKRKDGKPRKLRARSKRRSVPLNVYVSKAKIKTVANFAGRTLGVQIRGTQAKQGNKVDLKRIDEGQVRHPVFGRKPWVAQQVTPGFFSKPLEGEVSDQFAQHIVAVVNRMLKELANAGRSAGGRAA